MSAPGPEGILTHGQEALLHRDFATALEQFRRASETLREAPQGALARYLYAQTLLDRGDSPAEALEAFQAFLARDRGHAPGRLVQVAEKAVHDLQSRSADWSAWTAFEQTRQKLEGRPYPERLAGWRQLLSGKLPPAVARAARTAMAQEAMGARDWPEALRQWRVLVGAVPGGDRFLLDQLAQARRELRRQYLAIAAAAILAFSLLGLVGWRPWRWAQPGDLRRVLLLGLNWSGLAWLLYGLYQLGRRPEDSSPITWDRFLLLWGAFVGALMVGHGWILAIRGRISAAGLGIASLGVGTLLCGSALYLFCYLFDYTSVLGL